MTKPDRSCSDVPGRLDHNTVLARILGNGTFATMLTSGEGQIVYANDACCRMLGFTRPELLALKFGDLADPEDRPAHDAQTSDFERRLIHKDGHVLWIRGSASHLSEAETGGPPMVAYLIADITAVKTAELEREHLYNTLQSIGDAVICTDTYACVSFMNPVAERLTGWSMAEAAGRPAADVLNLIDERSGRPPANPINRCVSESRALTLESGMILLSRNGDAFDIGLSAAPIRTPTGIVGAVAIFNDMTTVKAAQKKAARSALHDGLTGLPNRGAFLEKLAVAFTEAREEGRTHALCFIDLDRFKPVNDRGGHAAGDALLCHVAKIIALSCSSKDVPARLGGDEFAVLIRDCTPNDAGKTAAEIVQAIGNIEFRWETQIFRIGASIGATMIAEASTCLEDILREADKACYRAKSSGRGQVIFHGAQPETAGRSGPEPDLPKWLNIH